MRPSPRIPAVGVCFALGVAAMLACSPSYNNDNDEEDDNQFRDDVIWCEEAVARLERCCPNFDATKVACQYYYSYSEGCGSATTRKIEPALTKEESQCIRERACQDLVDDGVCTLAAEQGAARASTVTTSTSSSSSSSSSSSTSSGTSGTSSGFFSSSTSGTAPPPPPPPRKTVCE